MDVSTQGDIRLPNSQPRRGVLRRAGLSAIRRILVAGLVSAGLYAAVVGASGATAEERAAEPTPAASTTVTSAVPAATAAPAAAVATPAAAATPAATATPTLAATATPAPASSKRTKPATTGTRTGAAATGGQGECSARLEQDNRTNYRALTSTSTSTSGSDCEVEGEPEASKPTQAEPKKKRKATAKKKAAAKRAPASTPQPTVNLSPTPSPTPSDAATSLAAPGPVPIGVPNFFIDKFRIPPFLLPIYQAAGMQYGVRWEVLAAINEIETDYGRNLNVSSAGALGWMQFMPATWTAYGVDANHDGAKDPFNPVDAIFAAARYLRAAGIDKDLRKGIFAYNHADWYVDSVLMRARVIGGLPADLVGSLTGLTQGRFPVDAKARYEGDVTRRDSRRQVRGGNAAYVVEGSGGRRSIPIYSKPGADVVAVNDGRVARIGHSERLGRFIQLEDVYGNTYTYADLGKVNKTYLAPKAGHTSKRAVARELELPRDPKPTRAASAGTNRGTPARRPARAPAPRKPAAAPERPAAPVKERLFAHPARPNSAKAGGTEQLGHSANDSGESRGNYTERPLKKGARVTGGTVLGHLGRPAEGEPETKAHLLFEIRPAGRGAPRIDPKPILDGWKLLESTAVYRAANRNPFFGPDAENPSIGQILLMSKATLERHVLSNPRIEIYECGRRDIRTGQIDRRVLATLEYLAASGLRPTVTSMRCGHGYLTASGNVSEHSSGDAVDIAAINGIPILGHQGKGSITETTIKRLLALQGTLKPHQIISLMTFEDADNTLAMGDHADHIHVGWHAAYDRGEHGNREIDAVLKPRQWTKLIDRLGQIDNPRVRLTPSQYAVRTVKRASGE